MDGWITWCQTDQNLKKKKLQLKICPILAKCGRIELKFYRNCHRDFDHQNGDLKSTEFDRNLAPNQLENSQMKTSTVTSFQKYNNKKKSKKSKT